MYVVFLYYVLWELRFYLYVFLFILIIDVNKIMIYLIFDYILIIFDK